MKPRVKQALTDGLLAGYAGSGTIEEVNRAGFIGKSSHQVLSDNSIYHDEWFVPTHLGGGQELVNTSEGSFTRLYAGGSPSQEFLSKLGTTAREVETYLIKKVSELGSKTRLDEDCVPDPDGDWRYEYKIRETDPNIPITVAVESILFKGIRVHIHPFILSPVEMSHEKKIVRKFQTSPIYISV